MSLQDYISIERAARKIGKGRAFVRKLALDTGIAIRWGGSERRPILRVRVKDLEAQIVRRDWSEDEQSPQERAKLHRLVKC
jgi:hypothetical protein